MKRTQLYLEDELWSALRAQARRDKTTVSDLVRRAAREKYLGSVEQRARAMQAIVGMWSDRVDLPDTEAYVRSMRRSDRLKRLHSE